MRQTTILGLAALACVQPLQVSAAEQADGAAPAIRHFSAEEVSAIAMPDTNFTETDLIAADYDKYFYFYREDTSFDEAYADILECDALSSGVSYYGGGSVNPAAFMQYGILPSAIGGAIGSALADATFGSAERRRIRRVNIRNCMGFKGYGRYGLERDLWKEFNFEEGLGREAAEPRERALKQQARVASGAKPQYKVLEL